MEAILTIQTNFELNHIECEIKMTNKQHSKLNFSDWDLWFAIDKSLPFFFKYFFTISIFFCIFCVIHFNFFFFWFNHKFMDYIFFLLHRCIYFFSRQYFFKSVQYLKSARHHTKNDKTDKCSVIEQITAWNESEPNHKYMWINQLNKNT